MISCPNKRLKAWKDLVKVVGENKAYLLWNQYEGDVPVSEYKENEINFNLKSLSILGSDKAIQVFNKGEKNKWSLDKILSELAIPKEQKEILLGLGVNAREDLLTNLLANYSYTIQIDTTKNNIIGSNNEYFDEDGNQINPEIAKIKKQNNSSYYSNLTVPGGTNYTENEIATPAITPSIKGHAQFATDNGIGWFRSDDKEGSYAGKPIEFSSEEEYKYNKQQGLVDGPIIDGRPTQVKSTQDAKIRRILEVQSDLFQKGRDKKKLADSPYSLEEDIYSLDEMDKAFIEKDLNKNQFLQLLNKDNNWVTFFIKSIVQDSAKKGYEKVLFPTGNTASKVEGHQTLEEHRNSLKNTIEQNKNKIKELEDSKYEDENYSYSKEVFEQSKKDGILELKERLRVYEKQLEDLNKNGFGALKPIYNFYENTVTNILKKQGLSPVTITDEYGNTWNEIDLSNQKVKDQSSNILFSPEETKSQSEPKPTKRGLMVDKNNIDSVKQIETINYFAGHVLGNFKLNIDRKESYQQLKNSFEKNSQHTNVNIAKKALLVLNNFEEFTKRTDEKLESLNLSEEDFQDENVEENNGYSDGRSLKENPNDKATAEIKKLFSSIIRLEKDKDTGEIKKAKNWLGLSDYVGIDEVMNTIAGYSANLGNDYSLYLQKLEEIKETIPYIKSVIDLLTNSSEQTKIQFTQWAQKHTVDKKFALWNVNKDKKKGTSETIAEIAYSNRNGIIKSIQDNWYNNFTSSDLVIADEETGELLINTELQSQLLKDYEDIKKLISDKNFEAAIVKLNEYLNTIGVDSTVESLTRFREDSDKGLIGKKRVHFTSQFNSYGIFNLINRRLKGEDSKDIDDSIDKFNPTIENSGIRTLAEFLSKWLPTAFVNSFRDLANNTIYSYSVNKYAIDQFKRITNPAIAKSLIELPFQKGSSWLRKLANPTVGANDVFVDNFNLYYIDGIKRKGANKGKAIDDMSPNEQEKFRLMLFMNKGRIIENKITNTIHRIIQSTFLTTADKSTLLGIEAEGIVTKYNVKENRIDDSSLEPLFDILLGEFDRIRFANTYKSEQNKDGKYKEFTNPDYNKGSELFILFPELNNGYNPDLQPLYDKLYDTTSGKLATYNTHLKPVLMDYLNDYVLKLAEDKLDVWRKADIIQYGDKGSVSYKFFDKSYVAYASGKTISGANNLVKYAAIDYVLNSQVVNGNLIAMFAGDPANYYKSNEDDTTIQGTIRETYVNFGKRLAGLIAPGISLVNTKKEDIAGIKGHNYIQLFAADLKTDTNNEEYLSELLTKEELKKYRGITVTDAQEYTTLKEHLYVMFHSGKLKDSKYIELIKKGEEGTLTDNDLDLILQPIKPVYFDTIVDGTQKNLEPTYIKTSSFPLIKQLTSNIELNKLREQMERIEKEEGMPVRLTFKSGNKLGRTQEFIQVFDKEGNVIIDDKTDWSKAKKVLNRDGFRIQQEVPYKEKELINTGSQSTKLLWTNLLGIKGFKYKERDKPYTGKELKEVYDSKYEALYKLKLNRFRKKFLDSDGTVNIAKLKEELRNEAISRNWNPNDIMALETVKIDENNERFIMPLYFNNSADRIESLLISIVDNKIRKNKSRGYSSVLGSAAGFKTLDQVDSSKIIRLGDWDGKELKAMRRENGVIKGAQVIAPFKFMDSKGNVLSIDKFIDKDNRIDITKLDPEILKSFGFRIPTQLHSSMAYIEIVGFMPQSMGDLIIAPADFTVQMGSDFDVDKLYSYLKHTHYNAKTGKLTVYSEENKYDDEDHEQKLLENDLLDIHISVMTNKNDLVQKQIMFPLGFGKLGDWKAKLSHLQKGNDKYNLLSDEYQKTKYQNARGSKSLVGIFSVSNTFNSVLQNAPKLRYGIKRTIQGKPVFFETKIVVDGKTSNDLSEEKTISNRYKSEVYAAFQSAALDNEKEALLEYLNISPETAYVINAMIQMGFDEDVIIPLINQPIIRKLTTYVQNSKDTTSDERGMSYSEIYEKFRSDEVSELGMTPESETEFIADLDDKGISLSDMNNNLKEFGNKDKKLKLQALLTFNKFYEVGKALHQLSSSLNTDSSGLAKNFITTRLKEEKFNALYDSSNFEGLDPILETGINAFATISSLFTVNGVFGPLFKAQYSAAFLTSADLIRKQTKKGDKLQSIEMEADYIKEIWSSFKSFVFANTVQNHFNEPLEDLRDRLLTGKDSLAHRIKEAKKLYPKNSFLKRLEPIIDKSGKGISRVDFKAPMGANLNELDVYVDFEGLLSNEATKDLALDLIKYFYITGGVQEATQFGKYISNDYLNEIGFSEKLSSYQLDDDSISYDFFKDFIRNNPQEAMRIDPERHKNEFSWVEEGKSFRLNPNAIGKYTVGYDSTQGPIPPDFISMNNFVKNNQGRQYDLYKLTNKFSFTYELTTTKGGTLFDEYGGDSFSAIVSNNKVSEEAKTKERENRSRPEIPYEPLDNKKGNKNLFETYNIKDQNTKTDIDSILDSIVRVSNNTGFQALAELLKKGLVKNKGLRLVIGTSNKHSQSDKLITIDKNINPKTLEATLLHEITHSVTTETIDRYFRGEELPIEQSKAVKGLLVLHNKLKNKLVNGELEQYGFYASELFEFQEFYNKWKVEQNKKASDPDYENPFILDERMTLLRRKYYGFTTTDRYDVVQPNLFEFVAEATTTYAFQKMLNEVKFDGNTSMFGRFMELINQMLSSFRSKFRLEDGTEIDTQSYLNETLKNIFTIIFDENPTSGVTKETVEETQEELSETKEVILEQYGTFYKFNVTSDNIYDHGGFYSQGNMNNWNSLSNPRKKYEQLIASNNYNTVDDDYNKEKIDTTKPKANQFTFTYNNKTIETEFQLSPDQEEALSRLIDFQNSNKETILLQGPAGTGKTSIIGYLQKYLGNEPFLYLAPTHAATAELAFATFKTGNTKLPATVQSSVYYNNTKKKFSLTIKAINKLGYGNTIIVDETSMLNSTDYDNLMGLSKEGYKVIFLGDKKQIPEISPISEVSPISSDSKNVAKAFTDVEQINLNVIHRTTNNEIKQILQKVRDSIVFQLYKIKENTENVKFFSSNLEFNKKLADTIQNDPENTIYIGYTNNSVASANTLIREHVFKRTGPIQENDVLIGYLGYSSKQIEKGDLANSIQFTVDEVEKMEGYYKYSIVSKKLSNLRDKGFHEIPSNFSAIYMPLSGNENLKNEFSQKDYDKNNEEVAKQFKNLFEMYKAAQANPKLFKDYDGIKESIGMYFRKVNLSNDYIYNPITDKMEKYDKSSPSEEHKKVKSIFSTKINDFVVEKGIDFGHAITIHKSQGTTIKNVFFDANTISKGRDTKIMENGKQISTERQSLGYVGLSRASENLFINEGWVDFTEIDNIISKSDSDFSPESLDMSVKDYMKELPKHQRDFLRNLLNNKDIKFNCK